MPDAHYPRCTERVLQLSHKYAGLNLVKSTGIVSRGACKFQLDHRPMKRQRLCLAPGITFN